MEEKFEEERRRRMEIEAKLELERKLREEQSVMLHRSPGCKDLVRH